MFELLAPVFAVAGGILAVIPVVLHLFRRTPAVRMPFSSIRFLMPSVPRTTRRSTLEHWPLMLIRILAVLLIGLAFSRPFQRLTVPVASDPGIADRIAILIDASASMRRAGIRELVLQELDTITAELQPADTVSVSMYSGTIRRLLTAAEWQQAEAGQRLSLMERVKADYAPDWLNTRTGVAMLEAADEVAREQGTATASGERRVILITDFQEGSRLDELRSGRWPDSVRLDLRIVSSQPTGNAGISLAEEEKSGRIRIRVTNSGDASATKYGLQAFDAKHNALGERQVLEVAAGQRRTISLPEFPRSGETASVELTDDAHAFDNQLPVPPPEEAVIQVAHAGSIDPNDADQMRYYLQRALDGNESEQVEVIDVVSGDGLVVPPPASVRLFFLTELAPEKLTQALRQFTDGGGTLVIALRSLAMAESVRSLLPGVTAASEAQVSDYSMLGRMEFSSALLSPFSDSRFADFSSIRIWKHRNLTIDSNTKDAPVVIAEMDSGLPAIMEFKTPGGGKIFLLTFGWHPDDSQMALSTRFPSLMNRLVQLSYPRRARHRILDTGERISPTELAGGDDWTLLRPDGTVTAPAQATTTAGGATPHDTTSNTILLDQPGMWILKSTANGESNELHLLVQVSSAESRTEPLPAGQLQALGMAPELASVRRSAAVEPETESQLDAASLESRQKFWRLLLLCGLALLCIEALVSAWLERRQSAASAAA